MREDFLNTKWPNRKKPEWRKKIAVAITSFLALVAIVAWHVLPGFLISSAQDKANEDAMKRVFENYKTSEVTVAAVDAETKEPILHFVVLSNGRIDREVIRKLTSESKQVEDKEKPEKPTPGVKKIALSIEKREFLRIRAPGYKEKIAAVDPGVDCKLVVEMRK